MVRRSALEDAAISATRSMGIPHLRTPEGELVLPIPVSDREIVLASVYPNDFTQDVTVAVRACAVPASRRGPVARLLGRLNAEARWQAVSFVLTGDAVVVDTGVDLSDPRYAPEAEELIGVALQRLIETVRGTYREIAATVRVGTPHAVELDQAHGASPGHGGQYMITGSMMRDEGSRERS